MNVCIYLCINFNADTVFVGLCALPCCILAAPKCLLLLNFYLFQDGGAEFVFATDSQKKRGWGERMFSSIGTSYMTGEHNCHFICKSRNSFCPVHQRHWYLFFFGEACSFLSEVFFIGNLLSTQAFHENLVFLFHFDVVNVKASV